MCRGWCRACRCTLQLYYYLSSSKKVKALTTMLAIPEAGEMMANIAGEREGEDIILLVFAL